VKTGETEMAEFVVAGREFTFVSAAMSWQRCASKIKMLTIAIEDVLTDMCIGGFKRSEHPELN
jgi:hypothetical protein